MACSSSRIRSNRHGTNEIISLPSSAWERRIPKLRFAVLEIDGAGSINQHSKQSFDALRSQTEFGNEWTSLVWLGAFRWLGRLPLPCGLFDAHQSFAKRVDAARDFLRRLFHAP